MADRTSTVRINVLTDAARAGSALGKFGKLAGAAALGIGGLVVGAAAGAEKLYSFADAGDDLNASIEQGLRTMKLFGAQTDDVGQRILAQAKAVSQATAVDLNSIKATQAKLLTFRELAKSADVAGGNFDRATKAAIDMAAKGFGTAETNAVQLGKALNDPIKGITALTRSGITFTEAEKEKIRTMVESGRTMEAQAFILKAIEAQVGGTAEATAGGFELMKNHVSIFAQELATRALPYMDRFGNFMIETGGPALVRFGRAIGDNVVPKLQAFAGFIGSRVVPVLQELGGWILDHLVPAYQKVLAGALEGARGLFRNVAAAVGENGPELKDMGDKLKRVGEFLVDNVLPVMGRFYETVLPAVGTAIGTAIGYISSLWSAWKDIWDIVKKVASAIETVASKLTNLPSINLPNIPGLPRLPGLGRAAADVPAASAPVTVEINVPGGFIGDEETLARKLQSILANDALRYNGVVVA